MRYLILISLFFIHCSSNENRKIVSKNYSGYWYETYFEYKFKSNGEFDYKVNGHFGNKSLTGKYIINNDTLLIKHNNPELEDNGVIGSTYLILDNYGCIQELQTQRSYCTTKEKSVSKSIERDKDISINLVSGIEEVVERDSLVSVKSNRKIVYLVESTPEENFLGQYWVKVSEDNGVSLVTHFNFLVNPLTKEVNFYDHINEKQLDLIEWRKTL